MREIVLDTETTGLDPLQGHRIVELAAIELVNHVATGRTWRAYVNPERSVDPEAVRVHGLDDAFLADKPKIAAVIDDFLAFLGDGALVAHNAEFDVNFLNAELLRCGKPKLANAVVDTLAMAKAKYPTPPWSLDALCRRFAIDNSARTYHGALLDCELLAEVYLELRGGRQPGLVLAEDAAAEAATRSVALDFSQKARREPRPHTASAEELEAHRQMLAGIKGAIWAK